MITRAGLLDRRARAFLLAAGFPTRLGSADYLENVRDRPRSSSRAPTTSTVRAPELEAVYERFAEPKKLIWIESADHFFAGGLDALEHAVETAIA